MAGDRRIAVIGLGYVGLPVAVAFARAGFDTVGFDIDAARVAEIAAGRDRTGEVPPEELTGLARFRACDDPGSLRGRDFFVVTVPTPITAARTPDLRALEAASRIVGGALAPGAVVVFESTVYPGATEEVCVPILEAASGLRAGCDFAFGYSPERINPGDRAHRLDTVVKVVSACDADSLEVVARTYGAIAGAGVHRAPSIRVAEAAKVIENVQRDVNIALMNEFALIFAKIGLDTGDVLAAARTKWNFLPFRPGLVGGHCIGVDPYYLTHRAQEAGHHPELVLAGRRINDGMADHVVETCIRRLLPRGRSRPTVTVLGVTFKEDIPDIRNSRAADIVRALSAYGIAVQAADPMADADAVRHEHGVALTPLSGLAPADAVILAVPHRVFRDGGWGAILPLLADGRGDVLDVTGLLDRSATPAGVDLWRL
ncbi:nucleotide sugar dehydrogenase [Methylobacterium aerolatum]|uniref:UDP-N-acetyl-D-galactosamine dehydrogenase n=1 Tax=Methylobacterium aerolatum TaxID=418708 RepID=A0ABU0HTR6_9HYPH|nr:nucleotide sugar dehydrogenase [Methylobacterium aerolatum]MDQ0445716.1 UDP-N-acetyl-D-galactosamine dehydrogenase [Methylobacterium aerolatum]GJD36174.1 UDP-N-acetyl-D-glucosamine 6-dehydrogenase [Methylobacterium aerolatum]